MQRLRLALGGLAAVLVTLLAGASPAAAHPDEQGGRPNLPDEQTFGTEHFLIHYSLTGRSAVEETDVDESGIPDFVELMAQTVEYVWTAEIDTMGWPQPPFDRGQGGDERIDIYLDNILRNGYAGYVETSGGYVNDNPNTPEQERRAAYAYMVLDNDYAEADPDYNETPVGLMQATVAHEFNHVIQAGIDDLDLHAWLYEATATWMEDQVYPDVNDGLFYLDSVFKNPDICMVAEKARGDDLHWYGNWLFIRLLSERYGPDVVLNIWNNMRQDNGFRALDEALTPLGTTLEAEHRDFTIANLLRAYQEGDLYPTISVEGAADIGTYTPRDGVQSLGADYVRLDAAGPVTVTLHTDEPLITLTAVGVRGAEADEIDAAGNVVSINPDSYSDVYLVVHNATRIADEHECWSVGYTLDIQADSPGTGSPVAQAWPTTFYVSPEEAPVSNNEGNNVLPPGAPFPEDKTTASTPEDLNVGFTILLPQTLPYGYSFDYAYVMTAEDFGGSDIYYVPGGGETANFDYLNEVGNWLSIAESPSPYDNIQQWMDDIAYTDTPGQIRQIGGTQALVEDLSETDDPWFSATFIVDDLFIVVDGDTDEPSVVKLVEGLVAASSSSGPAPAGGEATAPAAQPTAAPVIQPTVPAAVDTPAGSLLPDDQTGLLAVILGTIGVGSCVALACLAVLLPVGAIFIMGRRRRKRDIYVQRSDWY